MGIDNGSAVDTFKIRTSQVHTFYSLREVWGVLEFVTDNFIEFVSSWDFLRPHVGTDGLHQFHVGN